jgi:hypothetical protein
MAAVETHREEASWKLLLCACLLLVMSTLVVYWPLTRHEFLNYDDTDYVTANSYVQAGFSSGLNLAQTKIVCSRPGPTDTIVSLASLSSASALR